MLATVDRSAPTAEASCAANDEIAPAAGVECQPAPMQVAALDGLVYTPNVDHLGADSLSLSVDDLGNFGTGGSLLTTTRWGAF